MRWFNVALSAIGASIEIGFFQDSYTFTEGEIATVTFGVLSDVSVLTVDDFASVDVVTTPGSAERKLNRSRT